MHQFASIVREIRKFMTSFRMITRVLPYHLHIMIGGLIVLFLWNLLIRTTISYKTLNLLFHDIPLYLIAYYGFFVGAWLTLISKNVKYLPYGLWAFAFLQLFPFEYMRLDQFVRAAIYAAAGYGVFLYSASSLSDKDSQSLKA